MRSSPKPRVSRPADLLAQEEHETSLDSLNVSTEPGQAWYYEATLPEGVVFDSGEAVVGSGELVSLTGESGEEASGQWSEPVLFFPDGTTYSAAVTLSNNRDSHQRATLRALTGACRASEVLSSSEVQ